VNNSPIDSDESIADTIVQLFGRCASGLIASSQAFSIGYAKKTCTKGIYDLDRLTPSVLVFGWRAAEQLLRHAKYPETKSL
jgi:hypothetical protein